MNDYYIYIMANKSNSVIYTGLTNNLERRVFEHKQKIIKGFTQKYNCIKLVYYEQTSCISHAIIREKQIKGWLRKKKNTLIETLNPFWQDLSQDWYRDSSLRSE